MKRLKCTNIAYKNIFYHCGLTIQSHQYIYVKKLHLRKTYYAYKISFKQKMHHFDILEVWVNELFLSNNGFGNFLNILPCRFIGQNDFVIF